MLIAIESGVPAYSRLINYMYIKNLHEIATNRYLRLRSTAASNCPENMFCKDGNMISTAGYNTSGRERKTPHDIMTLTVSDGL